MVMLFEPNHNFLFRCESCQAIIAVEFEEEEEKEQVNNDQVMLECPCGGKCKVLRD